MVLIKTPHITNPVIRAHSDGAFRDRLKSHRRCESGHVRDLLICRLEHSVHSCDVIWITCQGAMSAECLSVEREMVSCQAFDWKV